MEWTKHVDACTYALEAYYKAVKSKDNDKIVDAVNLLQVTGESIMRASPQWEKIFQTSQHLVKIECAELSLKLADKHSISQSFKGADKNKLKDIAIGILQQDIQW